MGLKGTLYVICAPSGAGKTSLVREVLERMEMCRVSISHTTRSKRPKETDGTDYYFVDDAQFNAMKSRHEFLESAKVFNHQYGTSRLWVEATLNEGVDVILEIDWQGARQVASQFPCTSIFILPPSREVLYHRLKSRAQDDMAVINDRMQKAGAETSHYKEFDFLVVNDNFQQAVHDICAIIQANRLRRENQEARFALTLQALIANEG